MQVLGGAGAPQATRPSPTIPTIEHASGGPHFQHPSAGQEAGGGLGGQDPNQGPTQARVQSYMNTYADLTSQAGRIALAVQQAPSRSRRETDREPTADTGQTASDTPNHDPTSATAAYRPVIALCSSPRRYTAPEPARNPLMHDAEVAYTGRDRARTLSSAQFSAGYVSPVSTTQTSPPGHITGPGTAPASRLSSTTSAGPGDVPGVGIKLDSVGSGSPSRQLLHESANSSGAAYSRATLLREFSWDHTQPQSSAEGYDGELAYSRDRIISTESAGTASGGVEAWRAPLSPVGSTVSSKGSVHAQEDQRRSVGSASIFSGISADSNRFPTTAMDTAPVTAAKGPREVHVDPALVEATQHVQRRARKGGASGATMGRAASWSQGAPRAGKSKTASIVNRTGSGTGSLGGTAREHSGPDTSARDSRSRQGQSTRLPVRVYPQPQDEVRGGHDADVMPAPTRRHTHDAGGSTGRLDGRSRVEAGLRGVVVERSLSAETSAQAPEGHARAEGSVGGSPARAHNRKSPSSPWQNRRVVTHGVAVRRSPASQGHTPTRKSPGRRASTPVQREGDSSRITPVMRSPQDDGAEGGVRVGHATHDTEAHAQPGVVRSSRLPIATGSRRSSSSSSSSASRVHGTPLGRGIAVSTPVTGALPVRSPGPPGDRSDSGAGQGRHDTKAHPHSAPRPQRGVHPPHVGGLTAARQNRGGTSGGSRGVGVATDATARPSPPMVTPPVTTTARLEAYRATAAPVRTAVHSPPPPRVLSKGKPLGTHIHFQGDRAGGMPRGIDRPARAQEGGTGGGGGRAAHRGPGHVGYRGRGAGTEGHGYRESPTQGMHGPGASSSASVSDDGLTDDERAASRNLNQVAGGIFSAEIPHARGAGVSMSRARSGARVQQGNSKAPAPSTSASDTSASADLTVLRSSQSDHGGESEGGALPMHMKLDMSTLDDTTSPTVSPSEALVVPGFRRHNPADGPVVSETPLGATTVAPLRRSSATFSLTGSVSSVVSSGEAGSSASSAAGAMHAAGQSSFRRVDESGRSHAARAAHAGVLGVTGTGRKAGGIVQSQSPILSGVAAPERARRRATASVSASASVRTTRASRHHPSSAEQTSERADVTKDVVGRSSDDALHDATDVDHGWDNKAIMGVPQDATGRVQLRVNTAAAMDSSRSMGVDTGVRSSHYSQSSGAVSPHSQRSVSQTPTPTSAAAGSRRANNSQHWDEADNDPVVLDLTASPRNAHTSAKREQPFIPHAVQSAPLQRAEDTMPWPGNSLEPTSSGDEEDDAVLSSPLSAAAYPPAVQAPDRLTLSARATPSPSTQMQFAQPELRRSASSQSGGHLVATGSNQEGAQRQPNAGADTDKADDQPPPRPGHGHARIRSLTADMPDRQSQASPPRSASPDHDTPYASRTADMADAVDGYNPSLYDPDRYEESPSPGSRDRTIILPRPGGREALLQSRGGVGDTQTISVVDYDAAYRAGRNRSETSSSVPVSRHFNSSPSSRPESVNARISSLDERPAQLRLARGGGEEGVHPWLLPPGTGSQLTRAQLQQLVRNDAQGVTAPPSTGSAPSPDSLASSGLGGVGGSEPPPALAVASMRRRGAGGGTGFTGPMFGGAAPTATGSSGAVPTIASVANTLGLGGLYIKRGPSPGYAADAIGSPSPIADSPGGMTAWSLRMSGETISTGCRPEGYETVVTRQRAEVALYRQPSGAGGMVQLSAGSSSQTRSIHSQSYGQSAGSSVETHADRERQGGDAGEDQEVAQPAGGSTRLGGDLTAP